MLHVRRRTLRPEFNHCSSSSSSSSSSHHNYIINLKHSPRRPSQPWSSSRHHQQLMSSRRAVSGLLKSTSFTTTNYGWLDIAASRPHLNISRSLSDLRHQSADLRRDHSDLLYSGKAREALEPIQEAAEQTVKLNISGRKPRRICGASADIELNKENVRPQSPCSSSGHITTLELNKSTKVNVHSAGRQTSSLSCMLSSSSIASQPLNPKGRGMKDEDRLELGDVTMEPSSGGRALIPTSCTVAPDDDAALDTDVKRPNLPPTEFRHGLTRRSFSLPRIKSKFALKVVGLCLYRCAN